MVLDVTVKAIKLSLRYFETGSLENIGTAPHEATDPSIYNEDVQLPEHFLHGARKGDVRMIYKSSMQFIIGYRSK